MTSYRVHDAGVAKARSMIEAGQYDITTEWEDGQPSTDDENDKIERDGHDGYGEWHLAIDTGASEQTKDRYGFPLRRLPACVPQRADRGRATSVAVRSRRRPARRRRTARPPRPDHGLTVLEQSSPPTSRSPDVRP